jgi:hypothetical protein
MEYITQHGTRHIYILLQILLASLFQSQNTENFILPTTNNHLFTYMRGISELIKPATIDLTDSPLQARLDHANTKNQLSNTIDSSENRQPDESTTHGNGTAYLAGDRSGDPRERPQRAQIPRAPAVTDRPEH